MKKRNERQKLMDELITICLMNGITKYRDLMKIAADMGAEYESALKSNSICFREIIKSFQRDRECLLREFIKEWTVAEDVEVAKRRLTEIENGLPEKEWQYEFPKKDNSKAADVLQKEQKDKIKLEKIRNDFNRTQVFCSDETKYEKPMENKDKGTHWMFVVYQESAPPDWRYSLELTGLPFTVSPLHDMDKNPDGSLKKAHYHVIVSYGQSQRYSAVIGLREITHGPYPLKCSHVAGSYAYFTHKNNPEKAQYDAKEIARYNGWEKRLSRSEIEAIKRELAKICMRDGVTEYLELMMTASDMGNEYFEVAGNNPIYFDKLVRSIQHDRNKKNESLPEEV